MNLSNLAKYCFIGAKNAKAVIKFKAPSILMTLGIIGVGGGAAFTVAGTVKTVRAVDDTVNDIKTADERRAFAEEHDDASYPKAAYMNDKRHLYAKLIGRSALNYAPAVICYAAGIGSIVWGKHIMDNRHAALAAGYVALSTAFNDYRNRVAEKYGEAADFELRHPYEESTNADQGADGQATSHANRDKFTVYFDDRSPLFKTQEQNPNWRALNMQTINMLQRMLQIEVNRSSYGISPNRLCDELGIPRRREFVGLVWPKKATLDFGLHGACGSYRDVVNGFPAYYAIEISGLVPEATYSDAYQKGDC